MIFHDFEFATSIIWLEHFHNSIQTGNVPKIASKLTLTTAKFWKFSFLNFSNISVFSFTSLTERKASIMNNTHKVYCTCWRFFFCVVSYTSVEIQWTRRRRPNLTHFLAQGASYNMCDATARGWCPVGQIQTWPLICSTRRKEERDNFSLLL